MHSASASVTPVAWLWSPCPVCDTANQASRHWVAPLETPLCLNTGTNIELNRRGVKREMTLRVRLFNYGGMKEHMACIRGDDMRLSPVLEILVPLLHFVVEGIPSNNANTIPLVKLRWDVFWIGLLGS